MQELQKRIMIENHLKYNFYPPIPLAFTDVILKNLPAIEEAVFDEDFNEEVDLGENLQVDGKRYLSLSEFIEAFRLESFCPGE